MTRDEFQPNLNEIHMAQLQPRCVVCSGVTATLRLVSRPPVIYFIYSAPGGGNGVDGDRILPSQAERLVAAFKEPYDRAKIEAAGLYDDAGYCRSCQAFYCSEHWEVTASGGGTCPNGHFKEYRSHWSPESGDQLEKMQFDPSWFYVGDGF